MSKEEMIKKLDEITCETLKRTKKEMAALNEIKHELTKPEEMTESKEEPNWKELFLDARGEYREKRKRDNALLEDRFNHLYKREEALRKANGLTYVLFAVGMVAGDIVASVGFGLGLNWLVAGAGTFVLFIVVSYFIFVLLVD